MSYVEKLDGSNSYLDSFRVGKSTIVDSWFMMSSPVPIVSVVAAYLIFIWIGPKMMKNRPALMMNKLITYYNVIQVLMAAMICFKVISLNIFRDGIIYAGCRYPSSTQSPLLHDVGWWYFFAKLTELLDTVFFILRKKNKQVTFLHVYHHVTMALYAWSYLKFAAGGEGAILSLLNSAVHVVMYSYYLLAGLGPRFQKYLWWKKYVTRMQLIQFLMMLSYCAWTHFSPRCQFANGFTYFISANISIFLFLFLNFYIKSYKSKNNEKKIKNDFDASNGIKNENGFCKANGVAHDVKSNGNCEGNGIICAIDEDTKPFSIDNKAGGYIKEGDVSLTRRSVRTTVRPEYDFDSVIKK